MDHEHLLPGHAVPSADPRVLASSLDGVDSLNPGHQGAA
jgi:hypothetical protein